ncbi:MAG: hypothetical protein WCT04_21370 [Planctomycetota bacterium]
MILTTRSLACAACLFLLLTLAGSSARAEEKASPRSGKYKIFSYGATNKAPLFLGSFELENGKYKAYLPGDKLTGEGEYTFDAATQTVTWKTGPYAGVWDGAFTIDREGKTHKIRLKRTTIATNTIE